MSLGFARLAVTATALTGAVFSHPAAAQQDSVVLFQDVRIFDGSDRLSASSDVLVRNNRIERITPTAATAATAPVVIDGGGRTLMPGLIDMHWHAMMVRLTPAAAIWGDVGYNNILAADE